jgi:hypothetical protein
LKAQETNKRHEKKSLQSKEKEANQENNELGKYGKAMVELCSEIERNIRQFKIPPIGPLGKYIKLTRNTGNNENLANLLQNQIGVKLLNSFLVDNTPDRKMLQKLMEKQNFSKIPRIETKKSEGKRYDVSKFRIPKTPDSTLMLDHLEFEDDDVFNLVIDRVKPEGILVTNDFRVQALFQNEKSVPSFIDLYKEVYKKKYTGFDIEDKNISNGLEKLAEAAAGVEELKIDLKAEEIKLKEASDITDKLLKEVEIENKKAKLEKKRVEIIEQIKNFQNNFGSYNQKVTEKMALKDKVKAANRTIEEYDRMQAEIQAEIEKNKEEKDQKLKEYHERKQKLDKNKNNIKVTEINRNII